MTAIDKKIDMRLHEVNSGFEIFFGSVQRIVYDIAERKGWWSDNPCDGLLIARVHAELSECLEALRDGNPESEKIPNFNKSEEEMADVVIMVMSICHKRNWDLSGAILAKIRYNSNREYKHGGKLF